MAQGHKRMTVNATDCGFGCHDRGQTFYVQFPEYGLLLTFPKRPWVASVKKYGNTIALTNRIFIVFVMLLKNIPTFNKTIRMF